MIREFMISGNTYEVSCITYQNESKKMVIFINGFSHSKSDFDYFYLDCAKKLYIDHIACSMLFDYAGHGDSDGGLNTIDFEDLSNSLYEVIKYTNLIVPECTFYFFGMGIAQLLLKYLYLKNINFFKFNINTSIFVSPTVNYYNKILSHINENAFYPSNYVDYHSYEAFTDYENPMILWFANLGCFYENIIATKIKSNLLYSIDDMIENISSVELPFPCVITGFKEDPRKYNTFKKNRVELLQGKGVLPLTAKQKDLIFRIFVELVKD